MHVYTCIHEICTSVSLSLSLSLSLPLSLSQFFSVQSYKREKRHVKRDKYV